MYDSLLFEMKCSYKTDATNIKPLNKSMQELFFFKCIFEE